MAVVASGAGVLEWGSERARAGPWRADGRTAYLTPLQGGRGVGAPSAAFLRHCLDRLARDGYERVITSALPGHERRAFEAAGFTELEELVVLRHDLTGLAPRAWAPRAGGAGAGAPGGVRVRRGGAQDHARVVALDTLAFRRFWQLDAVGLLEAIGATSSARFRVAEVDGEVVAYAVTGRSHHHGYLQRLAVDPLHRRRGLGRTLVVDALRWLRRRGASEAAVNTQPDNHAALDLYRRLGFRPDAKGLWVLQADLG